jgi:mannose-1-phosphate guanylyltransferase
LAEKARRGAAARYSERVTAAMILCAGKGTRLAPLSTWCAKPLVPVGDRPALAHVVARVRALGGAIVVNAHHRASDVRAFAEEEAIAVSEERELLGTAGGVAHARALLGEGDVVLWNGDILVDLDPTALVRAHVSSGLVATLAIVPRERGEGNVGVDASGSVVRLRRETTRAGEARGGEFVGVHVIGAELRRAIPAQGGLIEDVYLPALHGGARLGVFAAPPAFIDIGTPKAYFDANLAWLRARSASGADDSWIGDGASIDPSARVVASVIGRGARVVGSGDVERCVVWPGAIVRAPMTNAIVAREGKIAI